MMSPIDELGQQQQQQVSAQNQQQQQQSNQHQLIELAASRSEQQSNPINLQQQAQVGLSNDASQVQQQQQQAQVVGCSSPAAANSDTRTHVVGELYDTERSYVESLQILVEKYMKPLKSLDSNKTLIESNLVDEIFYTIPEILQHHENFLSALQDRLSSDWDSSQVIGNVFTEAFTNQQIIDTYTAFINNWKNARQAIKLAIQAKPAFERFLEAMSREHRNKLTLDALLIMPVQRIPRYELLIKELMKHTPEEHPDYKPLIEAQKEVHELALKIDRAEKEMLHQEQLKDLESMIEGHVELQHPQRDFIRYDLVTISGTSALTVTAKKERVLFLFCDLLIMTSVKKKVSRRSNLQTAFANSSNDLSLLEGNKFKLLLRVSLDQVEIRMDNEKMLQVQQQQLEQQERQQMEELEMQKKILNEQRREIEADLYVLHQIEFLTSKLTLIEPTKLNGSINELIGALKDKLLELDNSEVQAINSASSTSGYQVNSLSGAQHSQAQIIQETCVTESPITVSVPNYQKYQASSPASSGGGGGGGGGGNLSESHQSNVIQSNSSSGGHLSIPSPGNLLSVNSFVASTLDSNNNLSDTSVEFIINCNPITIATNNSFSNSNQANQLISQQQLTNNSASFSSISPNEQYDYSAAAASAAADSNSKSNQQSSDNYDTLVVNFPSLERRQAFLQAFIEAKQARHQLFQQQARYYMAQNNGQKIFSSSVTLRLADRKRLSKSQQQDNIELRPMDQQSSPTHRVAGGQRARVSSASPFGGSGGQQQNRQHGGSGHPAGASIVHQMSAPHSLSEHSGNMASDSNSTTNSNVTFRRSGGESELRQGQAQTCISCELPNDDVCQNKRSHLLQQQQHHHHHHHHQLMHQPASQPASLDTICCFDKHSDYPREDRWSQRLVGGDGDNVDLEFPFDSLNMESMSRLQHHQQQPTFSVFPLTNSGTISGHNTSNNNNNNILQCENNNHPGKPLVTPGTMILASQHQAGGGTLLTSILTEPIPKFVATLPVNFLSSQHSGLQLSCAASPKSGNELFGCSANERRQTVRDSSGQLWLCMSNGYVSHVALIQLEKYEHFAESNQKQQQQQANNKNSGSKSDRNSQCYSIVPMTLSSSDICKSQINCAAQVKWPRRVEKRQQQQQQQRRRPAGGHEGGLNSSAENNLDRLPIVEVAIKSASPPIEIETKSNKEPIAKEEPSTEEAAVEASMGSQRRSGSSSNTGEVPLSQSAPSDHHLKHEHIVADLDSTPTKNSSASTTRLELPFACTKSHELCTGKEMVGDGGISGGACGQQKANSRRQRHFASHHQLNLRNSPTSHLSATASHDSGHHSHHHHHPHHCRQSLHHHHHYHHHHHQHSHNHGHHSHHAPSHHFNHTASATPNPSYNPNPQLPAGGNRHPMAYTMRHNTVPIGELRRALERQNRVFDCQARGSTTTNQTRLSRQLVPPSNSPANPTPTHMEMGDGSQRLSTGVGNGSIRSVVGEFKKGAMRSATPPPNPTGNCGTGPARYASTSSHSIDHQANKSFKSARMLRHQASLKTSAILAKLVSGASKRGGSYLRQHKSSERAPNSQTNPSDLDDNDTDTDNGLTRMKAANTNSDAGSEANQLSVPRTETAEVRQVVSPLSSVSSLNSTNSSLTINSMCASSPGGSGCNIPMPSWSSATCCTFAYCESRQNNLDVGGAESGRVNGANKNLTDPLGGGQQMRSRSATVPSRSYLDQRLSPSAEEDPQSSFECCLAQREKLCAQDSGYKVSEINDAPQDSSLLSNNELDNDYSSKSICEYELKLEPTLWLGCDDGSLVVIDCLSNSPSTAEGQTNDVCNMCNIATDRQPATTCGNRHMEIKLGAAICDIKTHKDQQVFVALSNGQLAIFSQNLKQSNVMDENNDDTNNTESTGHSLLSPKLLNVTANELNSTSKLCVVNDEYLWYSYGRNIYVLNMNTLKLENTIMAPTNDLSLQFTMQSIAIEIMELMEDLAGVWIAFKNSHLIQFYDVNTYRLLVEVNLFDPINKVLSYGNEILRQHKTACLKATSLLCLNQANRNILFVGTSAGILLYVTISRRQASGQKKETDPEIGESNPNSQPKIELNLQIASLRHGHSGQVRFMNSLEIAASRLIGSTIEGQDGGQSSSSLQTNEEATFLVSGGSGVDLYGPTDEHSSCQLDSEEDNSNYLMFWKL